MNYSSLLASSGDTAEFLVIIALVVVGVLLGIVAIFESIARLVLYFKYHRVNRITSKSGFTAYSAARNLLDSSGLNNIEVKQLNFFRALFYGNYYDRRKKTIFLRRNIINNNSVNAIGIASQKVSFAIMDKNNDKQFIKRATLQPYMIFAPFLFIPILLIGFLLDYLVFNFDGILSIISVVVAVVFYIVAIIYTFSTLKVEKRANNMAMEMFASTNLLDPEERATMQSVFNVYMWNYVLDFIASVLKAIQFILKLLLKIIQARK